MKAINIFGFGQMGQQVSSLFLVLGYSVVVHSSRQINPQLIHKGARLLRRRLELEDEICGHVVIPENGEIIDAPSIDTTIEDLEVKQAIYNKTRSCSDKLFASNTSSFSPKEIAEDVVGLHFFNPISMGLVEATKCSTKDQKIFDQILQDISRIGFLVINVKPNRGYLGNMLLFAEISNALKMIEIHKYEASDVEEIYRFLYPDRDIFNIIDLIGVDVVWRIMKNLSDKDASFYLADCLEQAVKYNLLGKKNRTSIRQLFN